MKMEPLSFRFDHDIQTDSILLICSNGQKMSFVSGSKTTEENMRDIRIALMNVSDWRDVKSHLGVKART